MLAISAALLVGVGIGAAETVPQAGAHVHLTLGEDGDDRRCHDDDLEADCGL